MVAQLIKYCERQLHERHILAKVEGRAKSLDSIEKSIQRREEHRIHNHHGPYESLYEIFHDIHDLAGVRIVVDYPSDIDTVNEFITDTFEQKKQLNIISSNREVGNSWKAWFGAYKSCNHHVAIKPEAEDMLQSFCNITFEVQLTSLPESLYNRLAHPLLYKKSSGTITRQDEMVIDMSHGLALCYSICLLCMQDKLEGPSRAESCQPELREAMRKVDQEPGVQQSDKDLDALVEMTPDIDVASNIHNKQPYRSWANDTAAEGIFWLYAPAGTGKPTLARSLVDDFRAANNLAAAYFFRRGDVMRNDTARIFPTIASQLMETIPHFQRFLRESLKTSNGTLEAKSLEDQFKILIQAPLSKLLPFKPESCIYVIVIDALDECNKPENIARLLKLFSSLDNQNVLRLCVLFTSRFAPPIVDAFGGIQEAGTQCRTLALHDEFCEETKAEIELVLTDSPAEIKKKRRIRMEPWPRPEDLTYVVNQATAPSPLFIYASTLLRFVDDKRERRSPTKRFQTWLTPCRENMSPLNQMYISILQDLVDGDGENYDPLNPEERLELSNILGSLILLAEPLSLCWR
ncbi:hypothetical protein QQX98_011505 [Neonectria punicea]|uniref:RelA/SpoT domain-containing protein n=1 Tax=Neonectria punicea TaxID=979145 RepID=A0ABR1GLJ0_9HYPO